MRASMLLQVVVILCLSPFFVHAEIANFDGGITSTPNNSNGVELRTGSVPPQQGVELFVFNPTGMGDPFNSPAPPFNTKYTIPFEVSEQPAVVVGIPGEILDYQYTENTSGNTDFPHTLTVTFEHLPYAGGVSADLPGPPGDFSIAIIAAVSEAEDGIPQAARGTYMATNISPNSWKVIPPNEEGPGFGFELNGPSGKEAFFDFFIPNSMVDFLSSTFEETLSVDDLALFNNNNQVSVDVTDTGKGGLIEIDVKFSGNSNLVSLKADDEMFQEFTSRSFRRVRQVRKKLTVSRALDVSLVANRKVVKSGRKVKLIGWAKDGVPGQRVKITSAVAKKSGRRAVVKKVKIKEGGKFSARVRVQQTDRFKAIYKPLGSKVKRSKKVKVRVKK